MRYFNTSGPCNPTEHYTVLRRELIARSMEKVRHGKYLTIFAPRQAGKTTFFHLLMQELTQDGQLKPMKISFENKTLQYFLTEKFDKNILNIVQKARAKQAFMLRLLFSNQPIPFTVDNPDIAFLYAHGVVENFAGAADILVPLYKKRLLTAFRPAINGETGYYVSAKDNFSAYLQNDGLNIKAILQQYAAYVARRGFEAFDTEQLKEGAWHYSLDGFINFFIERLGGQTFVEVPSGRGRTDILILCRGRKHIIETKIFTDLSYFEKGKRQLAEYVNSEGLSEGYYVVFSSKHGKDDVLEQDEIIDGKRIYTCIIRVKFERPSRKIKRKK